MAEIVNGVKSMDAIKPIVSAYLGTVNTVNNAGSSNAVNQPESTNQANPTDTVQFSPAAIEVAKYVSLARRIQDHVSPDKIAALKQAVATGTYPAPLAVDGLLNLVGSSLLSETSAESSANPATA